MGGERSQNKKRPAADEATVPEEEAFPRGGGDKLLTPLEKRQLALQASEDFQAEQKAGGKKSKKAKLSGSKVRPPLILQPPLCRRLGTSKHDIAAAMYPLLHDGMTNHITCCPCMPCVLWLSKSKGTLLHNQQAHAILARAFSNAAAAVPDSHV